MSADSPSDFFQLAVIGGGINGCGIARDAAGRGVKTFLCESGDLASATSSASTKLVHGGLRYLERLHFRLVRESLRERETLLRAAPHLVRPMRFVLPHRPDMRPAWMMRLGLALYDALAGRELLPPSRKIILKDDPARADLAPNFSAAFEYSDCWADDSRLTIQIARDAARRGAKIQTRARCVGHLPRKRTLGLELANRAGPRKNPRPRLGKRRRPLGGGGRRNGRLRLAASALGSRRAHCHAEIFRRRTRVFDAGRRPPRRFRRSF